MSVKAIQQSLDSRKKVKQIVHGRHPPLEPSGNYLVLTKLGEKITAKASLQIWAPGVTPRKVGRGFKRRFGAYNVVPGLAAQDVYERSIGCRAE